MVMRCFENTALCSPVGGEIFLFPGLHRVRPHQQIVVGGVEYAAALGVAFVFSTIFTEAMAWKYVPVFVQYCWCPGGMDGIEPVRPCGLFSAKTPAAFITRRGYTVPCWCAMDFIFRFPAPCPERRC